MATRGPEATRGWVKIVVRRRVSLDGLQQHAKVPSRGRQILLDDRDPASRCVRACIGGRLQVGCAELEQKPPRFPLTLVDWHSEQAKFDEGPYVTTVLGLDTAVAYLLKIGPVQDMLAYDRLRNTIAKLERRLEINLDDAKDRLYEDERYERPFGFFDSELSLIEQGFQEIWCQPLVHLLTSLAPYKELVERREKSGTLKPEFANWYALKQRTDQTNDKQEARSLLEKFENEIGNRDNDPIALSDFRSFIEDISLFKLKGGLAFTVVFQKALIGAYEAFLNVSSKMVSGSVVEEVSVDDVLGEVATEDDYTDAGSNHKLDRAMQLCQTLNKVIDAEPQFLMKDFWFDDCESGETDRFWVGSFAQMEGSIDFTQAASHRGKDILLFSALMYVAFHCNRISNFDELLGRVRAPNPGFDQKLAECFGRLSNVNNNSVAKRILDGREHDLSEDNGHRVIIPRMRWLWQHVTS